MRTSGWLGHVGGEGMRQCWLGIDEEMKSPRAQKFRVRGSEGIGSSGRQWTTKDRIARIFGRYQRCLEMAMVLLSGVEGSVLEGRGVGSKKE